MNAIQFHLVWPQLVYLVLVLIGLGASILDGSFWRYLVIVAFSQFILYEGGWYAVFGLAP